jgi:hypothetical protein
MGRLIATSNVVRLGVIVCVAKAVGITLGGYPRPLPSGESRTTPRG